VVDVNDDREPFGPPPPGVDGSVPHPARIWNFWLGGRDWYKADRVAGLALAEEYPHLASLARQERAFLVRAVRYLAGPARIRQFLDLGSGLPAGGNTHELAQRIAADTGVVYVDNDPVVLTHAKALLEAAGGADDGFGHGAAAGVMPAAVAAGLRGRPGGGVTGVTAPVLRAGPVTYVDADLRDAGSVLRGAAGTLDLRRPVAVIMLGVLGHIEDFDAACSVVWQVMDALPAGSYLAIADGVGTSDAVNRAHLRYAASSSSDAAPYVLRQPAELAGFFTGLELVAPGLVACQDWKPDPADLRRSAADEAPAFCGVGVKG